MVIEQVTPSYFQEDYRWRPQLPAVCGGPALLERLHMLDQVHLVVLIHIPSIIILFLILGLLIFYLRVPILASTSMLPCVIRYHTGRFVGAIERRASLRPLPFPMAVLIQTSKFPKDIL
jgi:hypothetical protein